MMAALYKLPIARLGRSWATLLAAVAWTLLALVPALSVRRHQGHAYTALSGAFSEITLPLVVFGLTGRVLAGGNMKDAIRPLVGLGAAPAQAAVSMTTTAMLAGALAGALQGALVAAVAHGPGDPPLAWDVLTSAEVGALGGAAYAALFAFGSTFGGAVGRSVLLGADWVLGASGSGALLFPRGHVRSLLGGELAGFAMSQRASFGALMVLTGLFGAMAVGRTRR